MLNFLKNEDGAITVDFVVLTAAITFLGLVVGSAVSDAAIKGTVETVEKMKNQVD